MDDMNQNEDTGTAPAIAETTQSPSSEQYETKAADILEACKWKDTQRLRELALSEAGLLSDEIRSQAC